MSSAASDAALDAALISAMVERALRTCRCLVDIGCGSGAGGIVLYTGTPIVDGCDGFRELAEPLCRAAGASFDYAELDPDVFGNELSERPYADVERLAAVGLVSDLPERPLQSVLPP